VDGELDVQDATQVRLERGLGSQYRILRLLVGIEAQAAHDTATQERQRMV
jgi:hypothetical protein